MRIILRALERNAFKITIVAAMIGGLPAWQSTAASAGAPVQLAAPTLLFDDEFNGVAGALPDATKWNIDTGSWNAAGNQLECYTKSPGNLRLDGHGHLIITARYAPGTRCGSTTLNYTSGRLDTYRKFLAKYGTIEVRMKVPTAQGMWPAFWAMGANTPTVGCPNAGEIDIMEALGSDAGTRRVYGTLHGPYAGSTTTFWSAGGKTTAFSDLSAYHTYAVTWKPAKISFQLDGTTYYTATRSRLPSDMQWMFNSQPFYLILNVAVGGRWPGNPDVRTTFPQQMKVDWVRVYSR